MNSREAELDRLWENTLRYQTCNGDIAVLSDLYDGLENSGYEIDSWQKDDHLIGCTEFTCFDRRQLSGVLSTLAEAKCFDMDEKFFYTRLNGMEFENMALGIHPSSRLQAKDLQENPMLLALLIGEVSEVSYYKKLICMNPNCGEIFARLYSRSNDRKQVGIDSREAYRIAETIARAVADLSDLEKRGEVVSWPRTIYFKPELPLGGKLGITYETPFLKVGEVPLYEVDTITDETLKIRELEGFLEKPGGKTSKALEGIRKGLEINQRKIDECKGTYFPCFKVISHPTEYCKELSA